MILIFANRGHGSTAIRSASKFDDVVLVTRSAKSLSIRSRLGFSVGPFHDPFQRFPHPASLAKSLSFEDAASSRPDMIICCSYHRLIPPEILSLAPAFNIHPGLLPQRGGGTPNRWAIIKGDSHTGVTAQYMTNQFDAGDIVWQEKIEILPDELWGDLETRLTPLIARATEFVITAKRFYPIQQKPNIDPPFHRFMGDMPPTLMERRRICRGTLPKFCAFKQCKYHRKCGL